MNGWNYDNRWLEEDYWSLIWGHLQEVPALHFCRFTNPPKNMSTQCRFMRALTWHQIGNHKPKQNPGNFLTHKKHISYVSRLPLMSSTRFFWLDVILTWLKITGKPQILSSFSPWQITKPVFRMNHPISATAMAFLLKNLAQVGKTRSGSKMDELYL